MSNTKTRVADMLGLPRDIVLAMPRIQMLGDQRLSVENHNGVIEYTSERIRVQTASGKLVIMGLGLELQFIGAKDIRISGKISSLVFDCE